MCDAAIPEHDVDEGAQTRFRKYATYKDSGIAWLGEVPAHWTVTFIKRRYEITLGKMLKSNQTEPDETEEPYLRTVNVHWRGIDTSDVKRMWFTDYEKQKLKLYKDDLLVCEGGDVGRSALWNDEIEDCYIQNSINRIRARENADTRFLFYWLYFIKHIGYIDMICNKATIAHFTVEKVGTTPCAYPPLEEQQKIAAFLDKETAQIAALVDEQTRLIGLLGEKRQAVISNAITKGLNPNAKMKDSGIEWIGEVPAHWEVKKLKFVARVQPSNVDKKSKENEERIRLCNYTDVYYNEEITADLPFMKATASDAQIRKFMLKKGDIIITKDSEDPNDIAVPAYVPQDLQGVVCGYHLALLRPKDGTFGGYLKRVMDSRYARSFFATRANGITRYGLGIYAISNFILPIPPTQAEQKEIADYLDRETERIDALVETCETAIGLLKERRTALISAAVTGKIDVRNVG